jgi:hypothetical protein
MILGDKPLISEVVLSHLSRIDFQQYSHLSVIITPEPLVGCGHICTLWKGLKIIHHFNIVHFS